MNLVLKLFWNRRPILAIISINIWCTYFKLLVSGTDRNCFGMHYQMFCYSFSFLSYTAHQQSQLICPQCNKCEDRLNNFPLAVRLIYARIACALIHKQKHIHVYTQSAGISLYCSFSSTMTISVCMANV